MKNISKLLALTALVGSMFFTSCETTDLDLRENPNALTPEQASVDLFLNAIQLNFAFTQNGLDGLGARLTRINAFGSRDYLNGLTPATLNGTWSTSYQGVFTDIEAMNILAEQNQLPQHIAIGQTLQAYMLINLVDLLGDVPWTQALDPDEFPLPMVDSGQSVYDVALALLTSADANFNAEALGAPNDFYYDGDFAKWQKLTNTLRMKVYLQTRLVDGTAIDKFNAIANTGNFIADAGDDFVFQWGSNIQQPNTRHPEYNANYTTTGAGPYRANWLMNQMLTTGDTRIRYYFFRQTGCTPGASCDPDGNEETLQCSLQTAPAHYAGFTFCHLEDGYWGRDHGDDAGGPPDGFLKTASGVYPSAGKFDGDNFANSNPNDDSVGLSEGGQGEGISPFMMSSYVDFMRAEVAMAQNNPGAAKGFILSGIGKSVAKVQSSDFIGKDPGANTDFVPTAAENTGFSDSIDAAFDAADTNGKWNILARQFFVAQYGAGMDAFNFYRRTGFPTTLQPNLEPDPGNFPKSFFYPLNETSTNPNIAQKPNLDVQVFWDNNPAAPGFPASN